MLEHERGDAAYDYVIRYDEPSSFPFSVASSLMQWFGDDERRRAVFRRAMEAWRAAPEHRFGPASSRYSSRDGRYCPKKRRGKLRGKLSA